MKTSLSRSSRLPKVAALLLPVVLTTSLARAQGNVWTSLGPEGGTIQALAIDPQKPGTIYALAGGKIFKTTDGAASWNLVHTPADGDGTATYAVALALDPQNSGTLYVGTSNAGVIKSTDGGTSWNVGLQDTSGGRGAVAILAIDPLNTRTLYMEAGGLFKSTDGGASWSRAGNAGWPDSRPASALAIDPQHSGTIYAGTLIGIYKSSDGGANWVAANSGLVIGSNLVNLNVLALAIDPQNPNTAYAAIYNGVVKTTDAGASWKQVDSGLPPDLQRGDLGAMTLAIDPRNTNLLYAAIGHCNPCVEGTVFKSTDGGQSWVSSGLTNLGTSVLAIDPMKQDTLYAGTAAGVFKSGDGGATWSTVNHGLVASYVSSLAIDPGNGGTLYAAADARVKKSTDGGNHWNEVYSAPPTDDGLSTYPASMLAIDPENPSYVYIGTGGNGEGGGGVFRSPDGGATWARSALPEHGGVRGLAADPQLSGTVYAWTSMGFSRSRDGGATWIEFAGGAQSCVGLPQSVAIDPQNSNTIYVGNTTCTAVAKGLVKTTDGGNTWRSLATPPNTINPPTFGGQPDTRTIIDALAVDPQDSRTVYLSTFGTGLFKSTDGGETWNPASSGLPQTSSGSYTFTPIIAVDPQTSGTVYASPWGAGVFKSTDGGTSWNAFNAGLTSLSVNSLAIDRQNPNTVYAGTSGGGVFVITFGPAPSATDLSFDRSTVVAGGSYSANISGSNLAPQTYFDVRFIAPGSAASDVALNWQIGPAASHSLPPKIALGIWTITGVRAHQLETAHAGDFVTVNAAITVIPN
jgi:photosystem II stability/assembly factor-like uncharacterized protein